MSREKCRHTYDPAGRKRELAEKKTRRGKNLIVYLTLRPFGGEGRKVEKRRGARKTRIAPLLKREDGETECRSETGRVFIPEEPTSKLEREEDRDTGSYKRVV